MTVPESLNLWLDSRSSCEPHLLDLNPVNVVRVVTVHAVCNGIINIGHNRVKIQGDWNKVQIRIQMQRRI